MSHAIFTYTEPASGANPEISLRNQAAHVQACDHNRWAVYKAQTYSWAVCKGLSPTVGQCARGGCATHTGLGVQGVGVQGVSWQW